MCVLIGLQSSRATILDKLGTYILCSLAMLSRVDSEIKCGTPPQE